MTAPWAPQVGAICAADRGAACASWVGHPRVKGSFPRPSRFAGLRALSTASLKDALAAKIPAEQVGLGGGRQAA
jgi:hypothetical protein